MTSAPSEDASASLTVLMVSPRFAPFRGGVETHVLEVGRRLVADHRIGVRVLTTDPQGSLPPSERVEGIEVTRVPALPERSDLYWAPAVQRGVRATDADLVHVQGYHTFVPPLAMLGARRARHPYVVTFHSGGHASRLRRGIRPLQLALLRPLLSGAQRLIAVSDFEAEWFAKAGISRRSIVTIPNGTDFPPGTDPGPRPPEPGLILSVGRLERYKGHRRVVGALPAIREAVPEARLMVVGDGPDAAGLRRLASELGVADTVTIEGVPRRELPGLLRRAAVVTLLSSYESQGLAAQEALAMGARLVVTRSSALEELSGYPGVALIDPRASSDDVADVVISQLRAGLPPGPPPPLPTWDACASALADLYRDVVARRRPSAGSR